MMRAGAVSHSDNVRSHKRGGFMKKIIAVLFCLMMFFGGFNCYALTSDTPAANLLTKQGKTGLVKEYGNVTSAIENAKSGDTVEVILDSSDDLNINANKNITITSGEKRDSQIIIGGAVASSNGEPKSLDNICLDNNGNACLIRFKNINVNGSYITETGDTNGDKSVNIVDLIRIKKSFVNIKNYEAVSDINLDKQNNSSDITVLIGILIGKYS